MGSTTAASTSTGRRWIAGLAVLAVSCAASAAALELLSAQLFHEADEFNRTIDSSAPIPDDVSRYYNHLWDVSFGLQNAIGPLGGTAILAVLTLLAVLALRWERQRAIS
jgi:hypothetical protein